jgi:hypothetical protein
LPRLKATAKIKRKLILKFQSYGPQTRISQ